MGLLLAKKLLTIVYDDINTDYGQIDVEGIIWENLKV